MATIVGRIKDGIGKLLGAESDRHRQQGMAHSSVPKRAEKFGVEHQAQADDPSGEKEAQPTSSPAASPEKRDPDDMLLDGMSFDLPVHARFLNGVKNVWRVIGPPTFVIFTAWEVFYYMNHFLQASDFMSKVLLWGITLLIEVPFMIATFDQAERKRIRAEKKGQGVPYQEMDTTGSILMWGILALVNVTGQIAFLMFITRLGENPFDLKNPGILGLWIFVCVRVAGVLVGDSYTAFFLRPDETTVERTIRAMNARGKGRIALKENKAELRRIEAESEARIQRIDLAIRREKREAKFLEDWQDMNMRQTLARQRAFMNRELSGYKIEKIEAPPEEPQTDQLEGL